jgi:hypothetical protein
LTAAARDGRIIVRAGTEEWLRQGPNKRMAPNRRSKCRQTRYPDPKPSTLHETGASPWYISARDFQAEGLGEKMIEIARDTSGDDLARARLKALERQAARMAPRKYGNRR